MADFSKVVSELKTQTNALNKLAGIEEKIEQQGEEIRQQGKDARRVEAGQKAWQTRQDNAQKNTAKATEKARETERTQNKILGTLKSISGGITSVAGGIGTMLKDKTKAMAGDIFGKLKKFAFGAAVASVLLFLNSKYWEDTKKFIIDDMIPALKSLWENVLSPILSVFKGVFVRQFENIKVLFDDLGDAIQKFKDGNILGGITSLIGGLGKFFLNTLDNAITGVYNLFAKLFGWEETDSVWGSIKGAFADVVQWFKDKFNWMGDAISGTWSSFTGFIQEKWDAVKGWFVDKFTWAKDGITGTWTSLTEFITDKFTKITDFFTEVFTDPKAALQNLWSGIVGEGGLVDILFAPIDSAVNWVMGAFGWSTEGEEPFSMKDTVFGVFEKAKNWVTGIFSWAESDAEDGESWSLMGSISEAIKAPIRFVKNLFTFSEEDMTAKGMFSKLIDIVYAPLNLAVNFVTGLFGWNEDEAGNRTEFSLGNIVTDAVTKIWDWFKQLLDIDINSIVRSIPGAERLLSWFSSDSQEESPVPENTENTETDPMERRRIRSQEIQAAKERIERSEGGENVYSGRDSKGREEDRELINRLIAEGKKERRDAKIARVQEQQRVANLEEAKVVPASAGQIDNAAKTARLEAGAAESAQLARESASTAAPVIVNNAPTTNNMSGGGGRSGSVFPVSVGDPDPKFRMVAANAF